MSSAVPKTKTPIHHHTDVGHPTPSDQQHGQLGPLPPNAPTKADQCDCFGNSFPPDDDTEASRLENHTEQAREHQQIDLAMLRLAFRNILVDNGEQAPEANRNQPQIRDVSCSELNQLVSAVVRLHGDERDLLGIKPPQNTQENDDPYDYLEQLSTHELIQLCYKEGITPPPACQVDPQAEDRDTTSQT